MIINSQSIKKELKKGLYLVSTPIGNLKDITLRAIEVLKKSDFILCEDTRVSKNLLNKYNIKAKLISNHKHNEKKNVSKILDLLREGNIISLISDAGTPNICDPGSVLVNECIKNDINVMPLPGASAVASAVSISGFSNKFFFYGFFPESNKEISDLNILSEFTNSLVFFISPKKINKIIPILKKNFSGRKILICREMTKFYEEFLRTNIDDLKTFKKDLKGELTIVISEKTNDKKVLQILSESDKSLIKNMIHKLSVKEIIEVLTKFKKIPKKKIYEYCLDLKNEK